MICCQRAYVCDYCPCCGRYLGPVWPRTLPWRPWAYPPPYYPVKSLPCPPRPSYGAGEAIREARAAVGVR